MKEIFWVKDLTEEFTKGKTQEHSKMLQSKVKLIRIILVFDLTKMEGVELDLLQTEIST